MTNAEKKYKDIINLEHHVSKNHPQMSMINRAAQFAPFAALTGFEQAIQQTANSSMIESEQNYLEEKRPKTKGSSHPFLPEY